MSEIKKLFGFDNQFGRPLPYVIFLIVMVSSLPQIIISSASPDCEQSIMFDKEGSPLPPEKFSNKMHSTQEEALKKCVDTVESSNTMARVLGMGMMVILLYSLILKPWIDSDKKTKRITPI